MILYSLNSFRKALADLGERIDVLQSVLETKTAKHVKACACPYCYELYLVKRFWLYYCRGIRIINS